MNERKLMKIAILTVSLLLISVVSANAQNFADLDKAAGTQEAAVEEPSVEDLIAQANSAPLSEGEASRYTLGPTDVIEINVMRHPEVSNIYTINQEGNIQYEFVGDVQVAGKTKDEVVEIVKNKLSEYIVNPEVSVKITEYNSKIVYVVGEVFIPGKIYMQGDTITVREALMRAGLPQLSGVTKKSKLITPSDDGKAVKKHVNVYALLYEGDLRENFIMNPGDVLYIPPTFLTKTMRAIQPVTAPIGNAAGGAKAAYTGF